MNERLEPRKAVFLLATLGEGSVYFASKQGGIEHLGWTRDRYLLQAAVDRLAYLSYVLLKVNGDKHTALPDPLPSPGEKAVRREEGQKRFIAMANQFLQQRSIEH
jgi:hypothetical protein